VFRHELKYFLNEADSHSASESFSSFLKKDENGNNGQYNVRSLYFDDIWDNGLFEKQSGIFDRKKFRVRHYNRSQENFKLECKSRVRDMVTKQSTKISKSDLIGFQATGIPKNFIRQNDTVFNHFRSVAHANSLLPVVIVEYQRSAWRHEGTDFRVTIDSNITTHLNQRNLLDSESIGVPVIDEKHKALSAMTLDVVQHSLLQH
jgi:hypothetical protein